MNLALRIARRYLFAKKSTNAINLITGIAVFGISVGTAALILVLSVFNGFEDLITQMYSFFDPEVKVTPVKGKTFSVDSTTLEELESVEGIALISQTLEEVAFFEYDSKEGFGTLKGVDDNFRRVTNMDSTLREGAFTFRRGDRDLAVLGAGMRNKLGVNVEEVFSPLSIYMAKRRDVGMFERQFRKRLVYPAGTFLIQQDFDNQYVLISLALARELLDYRDEVSALEIKLEEDANERRVQEQVQAILGEDFAVKNRYEQEEAFLKLMKMEKWLSYAIVSLMMLMVAFNMVGALWMIVLEKKKDIAILKSMGALDRTVRNIFLNQGVLLCVFGILIGFALALLLYGGQKSFGIVGIPGNFIVDAYPISIRGIDFLVVFATVFAIGLLASVAPAQRARRVPSIIREE